MKTFKAWITKYALTKGVLVLNVEQYGRFGNLVCDPLNRWHDSYHGEGRDWHRTRESAVKRVAEMRKAEIASLRKQIARLHKAEIEVPE